MTKSQIRVANTPPPQELDKLIRQKKIDTINGIPVFYWNILPKGCNLGKGNPYRLPLTPQMRDKGQYIKRIIHYRSETLELGKIVHKFPCYLLYDETYIIEALKVQLSPLLRDLPEYLDQENNKNPVKKYLQEIASEIAASWEGQQ